MSLGKVKEYDSIRGRGIIVEDSGGNEFVVYADYIDIKNGESLKAGQNVEFDSRSEVWAINVKVMEYQE